MKTNSQCVENLHDMDLTFNEAWKLRLKVAGRLFYDKVKDGFISAASNIFNPVYDGNFCHR